MGIKVKEIFSVQKVPRYSRLDDQLGAVLEYLEDLEGRVEAHEDHIKKLQGKAKRIEAKYRGLKKLLGPEST
jgi:predicted  nucleic acid-binding Zn-ribbon protein